MGIPCIQFAEPAGLLYRVRLSGYHGLLSSIRLLIIAGVLSLSAACSETVDPFIDSDRRFSLYGTLEMDRDTQFVRVVPVSREIDAVEGARLEATVTSRDLTTGDAALWRDSLMSVGEEAAHIFWAPIRIQASHTYRIEVTGPSDDVVTYLETTAPDRIVGRVLEENLSISPVNGTPPGQQRVLWSGLDREPFRVQLWYRFLDRIEAPFVDILSPVGATLVPPAPGATGWEVRVDLREDRERMGEAINVDAYALMGLGVEVTLLDMAFQPPGGVFDPDFLSQPGTFSNVVNGFGFVGIVGRFSVEWFLGDDTLGELDYRSANDVFGKDASHFANHPVHPDAFTKASPRYGSIDRIRPNP